MYILKELLKQSVSFELLMFYRREINTYQDLTSVVMTGGVIVMNKHVHVMICATTDRI